MSKRAERRKPTNSDTQISEYKINYTMYDEIQKIYKEIKPSKDVSPEEEFKFRNKYLGKNTIQSVYAANDMIILEFKKISERNKICLKNSGLALSGETISGKYYQYFKENGFIILPIYSEK